MLNKYKKKSVSTSKLQRKARRREKRKEKLDMYDMILANLLAGNSIITPDKPLDKASLHIGFSTLSTETTVTKYFMVKTFPDFLNPNFFNAMRSECTKGGVKINYYVYGEPHIINWESSEMKNKMSIWERFASEGGGVDAFNYRHRRSDMLAKMRIIESTKYLNIAELDHRRTLSKVFFVVEITCERDDESLADMMSTLRAFKRYCGIHEVKTYEMRINMLDWCRAIGPFCLETVKEVKNKLAKKVVTDDILAALNSYKQGLVGERGILLGMDIDSKCPVLRKIKENSEDAENWLISGGTGSGKSCLVKSWLAWLLGDGFVVTVMDYEGDEYSNFASYVKAANSDDVRIISMGKGSKEYYDPMEIAELTGDEDVDAEAKELATAYTMAYFRVMVAGPGGQLTKEEKNVIATAIKRVYMFGGVTENNKTWRRSKGLRIRNVYEILCDMIASKELVDYDMDNIKHKAASNIKDACESYFEEGGVNYAAFQQPISINDIVKASLIVFSFGMKGESSGQMDETSLALKQLSVANLSTQISNYCKYVKHCFNAKLWEEYQRWEEALGSDDIIGNTITGGRKRGDVNFIITNDLASMLDDTKAINVKLRQNITNMAIGKISDKDVIHKFCDKFSIKEIENDLLKISKSNRKNKNSSRNKGSNDKYKYAFCVIQDDGTKSILKARMPDELMQSDLFKTGVVL